VAEAQLGDSGSGLGPVSEGWFVVNASEARWLDEGPMGAFTPFAGEPRFPRIGINLAVITPGQPSSMYHGEDEQEDFLVLSGECLLLVEGEERRLHAWDFFHCAPNTEHIVVGAGEGPSIVLMTGTRRPGRPIHYPVSDLARRHRAGVEVATTSPPEAYAGYPDERIQRPPYWDSLPWA